MDLPITDTLRIATGFLVASEPGPTVPDLDIDGVITGVNHGDQRTGMAVWLGVEMLVPQLGSSLAAGLRWDTVHASDEIIERVRSGGSYRATELGAIDPYVIYAAPASTGLKLTADARFSLTDKNVARFGLETLVPVAGFEIGPSFNTTRLVDGRTYELSGVATLAPNWDRAEPGVRAVFGLSGTTAPGTGMKDALFSDRSPYGVVELQGAFILGLSYSRLHGTGVRIGIQPGAWYVASLQINYLFESLYGTRVQDKGFFMMFDASQL